MGFLGGFVLDIWWMGFFLVAFLSFCGMLSL